MTDEPRPAPQYGEYATPEELAELRGVQAPPQPQSPRPEPAIRRSAPMPAATTRPRRSWDPPITIGLLLLGFAFTVQMLPGFLDFSSTLTVSAAQGGFDAEFGAEADAVGIALAIVWCALLLVALGVSVGRLRAGKLAFWVPLSAGVLAFLIMMFTLLAVTFSNPAYTSLFFDRP